MINAFIVAAYWLAIPVLIILGILYVPALYVIGAWLLAILIVVAGVRAEIQDRYNGR